MRQHRKGPPSAVLIDLYNSGKTTVELAEEFGMHPTSVNSRLRTAGVLIRKWGPRTAASNSEVQSLVVSGYRRGQGMRELAEVHRIGISSVQRILRANKVGVFKAHRQTITPPTDPAILGYLAGIFDGEGNLQFKKTGNHIGCKLAIYNTCPEMMQWIVKHVPGGSLRYDTKRTKTKGWKPIGIWELYRARDVAALLKALLPYLLAKKEKAEGAIRHFENKFAIHDCPPNHLEKSIRSSNGSADTK